MWERERSFVPGLAAPADARRLATSTLLAALVADPSAPDPMAADLAIDVELVVSELVTNAVRAGASSIELALSVRGSDLHIRVVDDAPGQPVERHPSLADVGGRGLLLVDSLSASWGVEDQDGRKVVWAVLPVPAPLVDRFHTAPPLPGETDPAEPTLVAEGPAEPVAEER